MASTSERNQSESDMNCDVIICDLSDTSDTEIYSHHDTDSEQNSEADEELPNDDSEFYFGKDGVTKWKKTMWQKTQIRTRSVNIFSQLPGPKSEAKSIESESDAFTKIIDNEDFSRERDAKLTTVTEILDLFGLLIMSGVKRAAHFTYKELWAVDGSGVEIVRAIMSQERFLFLLRCLRFDDITTRKERKKLDKLAPIREFVEAFVLVLLDTQPDQAMLDEGTAREVINRIQKMRKEAQLMPTDPIVVGWQATEPLQSVVQSHLDYIQSALQCPLLDPSALPAGQPIIEKDFQIKNASLKLTLKHPNPAASQRSVATSVSSVASGPCCRYLNVELCGEATPQLGATGRKGTVLLENPIGDYILSHDQLHKQVKVIFGISKDIRLCLDPEGCKEVDPRSCSPVDLHGSTLYAYTS
ncbi:IARS [Cordylochernes scorpioides]|uniref:IARS n=1 Tax=Cordylochernes scorpioides TaxID=51811 RepID=A0ABY6LGQ1_9ARAC|nr:IARS [Cordylochernes scorpioides]